MPTNINSTIIQINISRNHNNLCSNKYFMVENGNEADSYTTYIRPVGYLHKNCKIISGDGTIDSPYKIKK